jgi:hypothetical protein
VELTPRQAISTERDCAAARAGRPDQARHLDLPAGAYRGIQHIAAVLLERVVLVWRAVEPRFLALHADGVRPAARWSGSDLFGSG